MPLMHRMYSPICIRAKCQPIRLEVKIWESHYVLYRQKKMAIKCVRPDIVRIRSAEENNDAAIKFLRRYRKPGNNGTRETRPIWYVEFTSDQTNF